MATLTWRERVAEIDAELAEDDDGPLSAYEKRHIVLSTEWRERLRNERERIVGNPEAWTRRQVAVDRALTECMRKGR